MDPSGVRIVLGPVGGSDFVERLGDVDGVVSVVAGTMETVGDLLAAADILVTYRWSDEWMVPGLKWIQSVSAGTDQYPLDALRDAGIVLTSAVGIHEVQVSEHAIGLLLALTRGIAPSIRNQRDHVWEWNRVIDLDGMTLGVLGLGTIGEAVARKASAFGMQVIGTKRSADGYSGAAVEVFEPAGTLEVCRRSDAVIVTLPGGGDTHHIVGAEELAALAGGFLINVGRGSVIDEAALVNALEGGILRGVGLDVFEQEPLAADSPLWDFPEVIVSPHLAGASPRYAERLARLFARNLAALRGEQEWVNRVV
jgi:phosphoglycerate dehydrogenase-like enzyme